MLFDLRSKGRRRAVKVIYSFLALIMVSGLLLVGVGTGGSGGLLNGLEGNGSSTSGVNFGPLNAALKQVKANPSSAAAWAALVSARLSTADQESSSSSTATTYTAAGEKQLKQLTVAWTKYSSLTSTPNVTTATIAARAYDLLGEFSGAALAWQAVASANRTESAFACVAFNAYAAKEARVAGLAGAEALRLVPNGLQHKIEVVDVKQELTAAKTSSSVATEECA